MGYRISWVRSLLPNENPSIVAIRLQPTWTSDVQEFLGNRLHVMSHKKGDHKDRPYEEMANSVVTPNYP